MQNFSPKEYKQSPQNWRIAQDQRGVMYFGNYGVLIYDGVSWQQVEIKNTAVRSLCIPPGQNKIYVGAQSDLGYLAADAIGRLNFVSLLDSIPKAHRSFKDVWRTFAIGEAIYFQTFEYIFRWAGGKMSVWTPQQSFHLAFVVNEKLYVRQRQVGLMEMAGGSLQLVPGGARFVEEPIMIMLPIDASTILIGTLTQDLFLYNGEIFTPFAAAAEGFLRENQLYHGTVLPKEIPQLPHLEIGAYMKTATEVGGDYYDFQVEEDGGLTVVIGDATGHGLNAGMMVTATKSVLASMMDEPDLATLFGQLNRALRRANLRKHYMALQMLRIKDRLLEVCAGGMPPLLIYRAARQCVEEITLKALPLGNLHDYAYRQKETTLATGDTMLLMSDGFPELFNEQGDIFDYDRVKTTFAEVAHRSPREIIEQFVCAGESWAHGAPQKDDMTFVVLKVK